MSNDRAAGFQQTETDQIGVLTRVQREDRESRTCEKLRQLLRVRFFRKEGRTKEEADAHIASSAC